MCGIIAYVGENHALPILISGLERLEYRGYDSAGVAVANGRITVVKAEGRIENLKEKISHTKPMAAIQTGTMGIGHTRWATHGEPSERNAHPHSDAAGEFVVVQNGIFENYATLKTGLIKEGFSFSSATDTEVSVHLLKKFYRGNIKEAFARTIKQLRGYFALVAMTAHKPGRLVAFKRSNPLVIGLAKDGNFVASDVSAILPYTNRIIYLEDEDLAVMSKNSVEIISLKTMKPRPVKAERIRWNVKEAEKSGFPHFMLKEIYEQPRVIREILSQTLKGEKVRFDALGKAQVRRMAASAKTFFVSCGTAYHAGLVGKYLFEDLARIPSEAVTSSEFRYSDPLIGKKDLAVFISQSGETADTLAALKEAKRKGASTLAVVNVVGSSIAREADTVIYTHAGPEIGVASTKAYTAQLVVLTLLAVAFAEARGGESSISSSPPFGQAPVGRSVERHRAVGVARRRGSIKFNGSPTKAFGDDEKKLFAELRKMPEAVSKVLALRSKIQDVAASLKFARQFLFLGRGYHFPSALEGALKLKEITYLHAHGYAAGEMKHGPIALVDKKLPVVCFAPSSKTHEKMLSNIEEIKAREGIVVAVGTAGDRELEHVCRGAMSGARGPYFLPIPKISECLSPILCAIVLQLFAYEIAVIRGTDVDHPRNLAKSVTVE